MDETLFQDLKALHQKHFELMMACSVLTVVCGCAGVVFLIAAQATIGMTLMGACLLSATLATWAHNKWRSIDHQLLTNLRSCAATLSKSI